MKAYELTVLVHPDLEMNIEPAISKVKALIENNGGKIIKEANEGKKKLAYDIKGQKFAVYCYYELELPASAPAKISSTLNITDEILRYLLVSVDKRKIKFEEKCRLRQANSNKEDNENETSEEE